jgi:hypothetical protein
LADPGHILDLLAQVNTKMWGTSETIGDLLKAMDYCIGLQAKVCGSGILKKTTLEVIKNHLKQPPRKGQLPQQN